VLSKRLKEMKRRVRKREHARFRHQPDLQIDDDQLDREKVSWPDRVIRTLVLISQAEKPIILPDERIVFTRTGICTPVAQPPPEIRERREAEDAWITGVGNVSADWNLAISQGLLRRREVALETRERMADDPEAVEFLDAAVTGIDAVLDLARRYADEARKQGRDDLAEILDHVPAHPPRTFHEALQSLRLLHSATWMNATCHVTLGRFDQYMWPYLKGDLEAGRLTVEQAEELLAELFISFNKDNDLYPGVQQGDNGQSLMLGGVTPDGHDAVNDLTWMVLRVSHDVNMIDPKINLRINRDTDLDLLTEAARLTRRGLGFPQYANDDVEIAALAAHGYDLEDARDYTVAACWEFIIPGVAMDVPNINGLNFPAAADQAIRESLAAQENFDDILRRTRQHIAEQVDLYVANWRRARYHAPQPWYSVIMTNCLETGRDVNRGGAKYYNCGIHGSGSANAADALAAVKKFVFDDKSIEPGELVNALITDFANDEPLRQKLLNEGPKVGNNDEEADALLVRLFDDFADACEAVEDAGRSAVVRPGTGSAMYYVSLVRGEEGGMLEPVVGASADGRHEGDFIGSSLAPSPGVKIRGPVSVLQSFSKIDYHRIYNGGPITMELSDTVFRDEECLQKVAMLVRTFARLGCQQLQLNTLNVETLLDAQKHPEQHRNLIVRVWGWSGYFCELDEPYQEHIIARHSFAL